MYKLITLLFVISFALPFNAQKNADDIIGTWYTAEKESKIRIYKCGNEKKKYCGKIAWIKEPNEEDGSPKVDKNNPKTGKRKDPLLNLIILKLFEYDEDDREWVDGTIYDPKNGKTYSCIIKKSGNELHVRGYVGISLIGRTTVWTRIE